MPISEIKLTPTQAKVLRAIAAGGVSRSESIADLFKTYVGGRNVGQQVKALRAHELIELGEIDWTSRPRRPWLLTDAGRRHVAELPTRPNSSTRVPSRVQARDEPCADPANCDVHEVDTAPKPQDDHNCGPGCPSPCPLDDDNPRGWQG